MKLSTTMQTEFDAYKDTPEDPAWLTERHIKAVAELEAKFEVAEAKLTKIEEWAFIHTNDEQSEDAWNDGYAAGAFHILSILDKT